MLAHGRVMLIVLYPSSRVSLYVMLSSCVSLYKIPLRFHHVVLRVASIVVAVVFVVVVFVVVVFVELLRDRDGHVEFLEIDFETS